MHENDARLLFWPSAVPLAGLPRSSGFPKKKCFESVVMRWLVIGFLVSLGALLIAAAGIARHIRRHHAQARAGLQQEPAMGLDLPDETELEPEP